jgi:hypothetical protein
MRQTVLLGLLGVAVALVALVLLWSSPIQNVDSSTVDAGAIRARPPNAPTEPMARVSVGVVPRRPLAANDAPDVEEDESPPSASTLGTPESRIDALVGAGFARTRAEEIVSREAELRRTAAVRQYEATGTVAALTNSAQLDGEAGLRAELGDADFERYLAALGRPTRVAVGGVAAESSAANAGLIPGDEIRSYGGRRVFNLRELNELAQRHALGETVAVAVIRDGVAMQLYVTGGPLGLTPAQLR